jgi:hypothetical protein
MRPEIISYFYILLLCISVWTNQLAANKPHLKEDTTSPLQLAYFWAVINNLCIAAALYPHMAA